MGGKITKTTTKIYYTDVLQDALDDWKNTQNIEANEKIKVN